VVETSSQGDTSRSSHHHASHQQQHQLAQPGVAAYGPWGFAGQGGRPSAVDPWGRSFSDGGSVANDLGQPPTSSNWNHPLFSGWPGQMNHKGQGSQPMGDSRLSQYVVGLPAEIIDQVLTVVFQLTCLLTVPVV
jgi:hypothetical protein